MFSKYCSLVVKLRQFAFVQGDAFSSRLSNWLILKEYTVEFIYSSEWIPEVSDL